MSTKQIQIDPRMSMFQSTVHIGQVMPPACDPACTSLQCSVTCVTHRATHSSKAHMYWFPIHAFECPLCFASFYLSHATSL